MILTTTILIFAFVLLIGIAESEGRL